ncbi:MAG: hypothetical protein NTZ69_02800 [Bacteroidia bacterium]|nr:hypothetical protein [Bacteroidia bacterium]
MDTNEFKKPINLISLFLAILGILVGIYFYHSSKQYRDICYQVDHIASKIYDSKNTTSNLHLIDKDSLPIIEDVYYIRGKIWNSGNLSIPSSDVRVPLKIELKSCKRILDFKIEKQYEDSTQCFQLKEIGSNALEINWRYFDPNNGFSYQIIYLGEENVDFSLKGKILNISNFKEIDPNSKHSLWYTIISLILVFLFGFFSDNIFPSIFGAKSKLHLIWRVVLVAVIGILISIVFQYFIPKFSQITIPF